MSPNTGDSVDHLVIESKVREALEYVCSAGNFRPLLVDNDVDADGSNAGVYEISVTEPQLRSFMEKVRRVGSEFSSLLISRMVTAATSATAVTAIDISRCIAGRSPYGHDWKLLVDFLLRRKVDSEQAAERARRKHAPTYIGSAERVQRSARSSTLRSSLRLEVPSIQVPKPPMSARSGTARSTFSYRAVTTSRNTRIVDHIAFPEVKHPYWSVHHEQPLPSLPAILSGRGSKKETALAVAAPSKPLAGTLLPGFGDSVICCHHRGTALSIGGNPAVRAVVVDLSRVKRVCGAHFDATISPRRVVSRLEDTWALSETKRAHPTTAAETRTSAQEQALNNIIAYIER